MIEVGGDLNFASAEILSRTGIILEQAVSFMQACREEEQKGMRWWGKKPAELNKCIRKQGKRVAVRVPEEAQAWEALPIIVSAAIRVLMRRADARSASSKLERRPLFPGDDWRIGDA